MSAFTGIPMAAVEFYAALEENNNKEWWLGHKDIYDAVVRAPLLGLQQAAEGKFGSGKIFRPHRDVRFSPDKSPYKIAQGMFVSNYEEVGFYVQIDADGLLVGGGYHSSSPAQLSRYRAAVDSSASGAALETILKGLSSAGFTLEGQTLKRVPQGFTKDHPRAELLKHKTVSASKHLGTPLWMETAQAEQEILSSWEQLRPLVDWVIRYAAP